MKVWSMRWTCQRRHNPATSRRSVCAEVRKHVLSCMPQNVARSDECFETSRIDNAMVTPIIVLCGVQGATLFVRRLSSECKTAKV
jgi:hypothetical protein